MKDSIKLLSALIAFSLIMNSCSSEDDENFTPSASDIVQTIDENPTNGQTLGNVATNLTGTLIYSITSQTVNDAFAVNSTTGEITINDASKFDYETNQTLGAIISVTNSEESATSSVLVTLNDVDDILSFLNTSRQAYMDADVNDWVIITENEYNNLAANLTNITKSGSSDEELDTNDNISSLGSNYTIANDNGKSIPNNSYLFALKYYCWSNNAVSNKVKLSQEEVTGSYTDFANTLPQHNSGYNYFVLKSANTPTESESYLSMYTAVSMGYKQLTGSLLWYKYGDDSALTNATAGLLPLYQGLSTTLKQWD